MFSRRLVITIPRSGAVIIAIGIFAALYNSIVQAKFLIAIGIISAIVAVGTVLEARHQLRTFRYEVSDKITEILESYLIPEDDMDLRDKVEEIFEGVGVKDNTTHAKLRLSKRPNSGRANKS